MATKKQQSPLGAGVAIAISAAFIGLIIGAVFAHRYVSQHTLDADELKGALEDEINERVDEEVEKELERLAEQERLEEEASATDAEKGTTEPDPEDPDTHLLYTNAHFGVQFSFPNTWNIFNDVFNRDLATQFLHLNNKSEEDAYGVPGNINFTVTEVVLPDQSFDAYVATRIATDESIEAEIERINEFVPVTINDVTFDTEELVVNGHRTMVSWKKWTVPTYMEGPAITERTYFIEDEGRVFEVSITAPTFDSVDNVIQEGRNVVATWEFIEE